MADQTPTHDFLEQDHVSDVQWIQKDFMMFDDPEEAEQYLRDEWFGTDGQGLDHETNLYQG